MKTQNNVERYGLNAHKSADIHRLYVRRANTVAPQEIRIKCRTVCDSLPCLTIMERAFGLSRVGSFAGHQPPPRAIETEPYSESGGQKDIDFPRLDFLEVSSGNFGLLGQLLLRHAPTHALPAHIRAESPDSRPFFFAKRHDILHRGGWKTMNDMVHREKFGISLAKKSEVVKLPSFSGKLPRRRTLTAEIRGSDLGRLENHLLQLSEINGEQFIARK